MDESKRDFRTSLGLLVLRLGAGGFMALHGWGKVEMALDGKFEQFGSHMGLGPHLSLLAAAGAEFGCALLVLAGVFTRWTAIPVAFTMAVAAFAVHTNDPWTMGEGARLFMEKKAESWSSKEPALLFLIPFLALAFLGSGRFSFDGWLAGRRSGGDGVSKPA